MLLHMYIQNSTHTLPFSDPPQRTQKDNRNGEVCDHGLMWRLSFRVKSESVLVYLCTLILTVGMMWVACGVSN